MKRLRNDSAPAAGTARGAKVADIGRLRKKYTKPRSTTQVITGRFTERGPRVAMALIDPLSGSVLAQVEVQPDTLTLLRAFEALGVVTDELELLHTIIADGGKWNEYGVEMFRDAKERIADAKAVLA